MSNSKRWKIVSPNEKKENYSHPNEKENYHKPNYFHNQYPQKYPTSNCLAGQGKTFLMISFLLILLLVILIQ